MARVDEAPGSDTIIGIVTSTGEGRRSFLRLVWGLVALTLLAIVLAVVGPRLLPTSPTAVAAKIARVPSDARVLSAEETRRQEGTIVFTLPEPKGPGSRLMEIWTLNGLMPPAAATPMVPGLGGIPVRAATPAFAAPFAPPVYEGHSISWEQPWSGNEVLTHKLTYDPGKRVYRYEERRVEKRP